MAQPFTCFCGTPSCRGLIGGARNMTQDQLAGLWLNGHIWELLNEQKKQQQLKTARPENGTSSAATTAEIPSAIEQALKEELARAEESLHKADQATEAARRALAAHRNGITTNGKGHSSNGTNGTSNGVNGAGSVKSVPNGAARHGTSSRELGGELGGDTAERT